MIMKTACMTWEADGVTLIAWHPLLSMFNVVGVAMLGLGLTAHCTSSILGPNPSPRTFYVFNIGEPNLSGAMADCLHKIMNLQQLCRVVVYISSAYFLCWTRICHKHGV